MQNTWKKGYSDYTHFFGLSKNLSIWLRLCNLSVIFPHKMHLRMHIFLNSCYLLFGIQQAVNGVLSVTTPTSLLRFTHNKGLAKSIFWTRGSALCTIRGLQLAPAWLICFDFELIQNKVLLFSLQSRQKHDCFRQFCVIGKNLKLSFRVEQLTPPPEGELNCNAIFLQKADSSTLGLTYVWQMPIA